MSAENKKGEVLLQWYPTVLAIGVFVLFLGIWVHSLLLLVVAGIITGTYYGLNNDRVWHFSYKTDFYAKNKNFEEIQKMYVIPSLNPVAKAHQIWIHVLCGLIAGVTLYILVEKFNLANVWFTFKRLDLKDYILLLISTLGYTGLLPRTLWFFASRGDLNK